MNKYFITISREFGCNAREIARGLAGKLGIELYDKELVDMAVEQSGIHIDEFNDSDKIIEKPEVKLTRIFSYGSSTQFYSEQAIQAQIKVIKQLANKDKSAIFFGRCSDYVLNEYPNVLNIFLYAPLKDRITHMMKSYNLNEKEAERMIKRVDKQRHNYYKFVTGTSRGDRERKHIMIDVNNFGTEGTIDLLCDIVNNWYINK